MKTITKKTKSKKLDPNLKKVVTAAYRHGLAGDDIRGLRKLYKKDLKLKEMVTCAYELGVINSDDNHS